jgi:hypothetical protein
MWKAVKQLTLTKYFSNQKIMQISPKVGVSV